MLTLSTPICENRFVPRKKAKATYHHGNLREQLIECGLRLIQEKGIQALTLREIGSRLGVSRSAAYRHFEEKAAFLEAIREAGFIAFGDALLSAKEAAAPDFASRLDAMGAAYVRFATRHRAHFEVMFAEAPDPRRASSAAGDRAFAILEDTIREGQSSGDVRPGDSKLLARAVWAQVHGVSMLRLDSDPSTPGFAQFSSEIIRAGIATPPGREISAARIQEKPRRAVDSPSAA